MRARIERMLKRTPNPSAPTPTPLAILDQPDLKEFLGQRRAIADQARLLAMLQVCYTSFLSNVEKKYKVPHAISINVQTGEVHPANPELTDV